MGEEAFKKIWEDAMKSVEERVAARVEKRFEELLKKVQGGTPPKHEHRFADAKDGGVFCVDCGERYYKVDDFEDILKRLRVHHGSPDFLSCPACRPKFTDFIKELGYEVKDDGRRLEIRRRR